MNGTADATAGSVVPADWEHLTCHRARMQPARHELLDGYGMSLGLVDTLVHTDDGQLLTSLSYGNQHLPVYDIDIPLTVDDTGTLTLPTVTMTRRHRRRLERRLESAGCLFFVRDLDVRAVLPLRLDPAGCHRTPFEIVPSRTAGHCHLFDLERRRARDYLRTVAVLAAAGVVDAAWAQLTRHRGFGAVLAPGSGPLKQP